MNYIEEYYHKIKSGEIVAGLRIHQMYDWLYDKLKHPEKHKPWVFDEERANDPIIFTESFCKQAQGDIGSPLKLELFQKAKKQAIYGFVHEETGERQCRESLTIEGRKNGKTTENAADSLYMLVYDDEGSPEVYSIATALDQAKKVYNEADKMRMQSTDIRQLVRRRASDLYCDFNMGFLKALASNSNSLDGLNAHFVTIDELAAIKNRDIYDLMKQSMGSRYQPLLSCITTNGFVRNGIYDDQYKYAIGVLDGKIKDDRFFPFIYELDDYDEWDKPEMWPKANPGLGSIKSFEFLEACVNKAKEDEGFKPTVMVKDFNLTENAASAWLPWSTLNNESTFKFKDFRYGIGGFDGADTTDLNFATCLVMKRDDPTIYCKCMAWMPEDVYNKLTENGIRKERDGVPYTLWHKQGLLRLYPGPKVNKRVFLDWFREIRDDDDCYIFKIGYDDWHIDDSLLADFQAEFGHDVMVKIRQGEKTLSNPMKELKPDLANKLINYNNNPILKWCLMNTHIKTSVNGGIQPIKGLDSRERIDGTIALLCAYIVLKNNYNSYVNMI